MFGVVLSSLLLATGSASVHAQSMAFVAEGDNASYFKGTEEPSPDAADGSATTEWTAVEFDDATWLQGPQGVGYADGDDQTVLDDMRDSYTSYYVRVEFEVDLAAAVTELLFEMSWDDGFLAYLNGIEIARDRLGAVGSIPTFDALADGGHEATAFEPFPVDPALLHDGTNVLAFQVHNTAIGSSDASGTAILTGNPLTCPINLTCDANVDGSVSLGWSNQGESFPTIRVVRDGEVVAENAGANAETFVDPAPGAGAHTYEIVAVSEGDIECAPIACSVVIEDLSNHLVASPGAPCTYFKGTEAPPEDWTEVDFAEDERWLDGVTGLGYADGDDHTVLDDMRDGYLAFFVRIPFEVAANELPIARLALRIDYDDSFVAYLNGVEITRAGLGQAGSPVAFDATGTNHEAGTPVDFGVADPGLVRSGLNVLAIEIHNQAIGSSDASCIPELVRDTLLCPGLNDITCTVDQEMDEVNLSWINFAEYESIEVRRNGETIADALAGDVATFTDKPGEGAHTYEVIVTEVDGTECPPMTCTGVFVEGAGSTIIFDEGGEIAFLRAVDLLPEGWETPELDDTAWERGPTGIGYGDGDDATDLSIPGPNGEPAMEDNYAVVLTRLEFELANLAEVTALRLRVRFDDGVAVFLNGEEIRRVNLPLDQPITDALVANVTIGDAPASCIGPDDPAAGCAIVDLPLASLVEGTNLLAVSVHNTGLGSSDLSYIPTLVLTGPDGEVRNLFVRGDADQSGGTPNLTDAVRILNALFGGLPFGPGDCLDAADTDDNGGVTFTDDGRLLNSLFGGMPEPPAPGFSCGEDPTDDALGNCAQAACS